MRGKLLFAAGLAAGYVIGARAGRPAYDAIRDRAAALRDDPTVRSAGAKAERKFEEAAPKVAAAAEGVARTGRAALDGTTSAGDGAGDDNRDDAPDSGPAAPNGSKPSNPSARTTNRGAGSDGSSPAS